MQVSTGQTSVDIKLVLFPLASNTLSTSSRRRQRPSVHPSHKGLWISLSTVSSQDICQSELSPLLWRSQSHLSRVITQPVLCVVQWERGHQSVCPHMMQVMEAGGSVGPALTPPLPPWTKTSHISSATGQTRRTTGRLASNILYIQLCDRKTPDCGDKYCFWNHGEGFWKVCLTGQE